MRRSKAQDKSLICFTRSLNQLYNSSSLSIFYFGIQTPLPNFHSCQFGELLNFRCEYNLNQPLINVRLFSDSNQRPGYFGDQALMRRSSLKASCSTKCARCNKELARNYFPANRSKLFVVFVVVIVVLSVALVLSICFYSHSCFLSIQLTIVIYLSLSLSLLTFRAYLFSITLPFLCLTITSFVCIQKSSLLYAQNTSQRNRRKVELVEAERKNCAQTKRNTGNKSYLYIRQNKLNLT